MSKFFTTLTAVDNYGGKSFFSGEGKTEQESIDKALLNKQIGICLLYTSPSPRDCRLSRMPSSA